MRTRDLFFASAVALTSILGSPRAGGTAPAAQDPSGAPILDGMKIAMLVTKVGAATTSLYVTSLRGSAPPPPSATLSHLEGATVRASVLPGTDVLLATADTAETRDLSFNASLFRIAPGAPPERLCDGVVHASRPLVTRGGRVFVSRGEAGAPAVIAGREAMRVDALSIEEVDPWTGALRTVHTVSGYLAFLAGELDGEVIVYRVRPEGADIVGIDADTGAERVIVASLPPFARDFSVDAAAAALVYRGRHETDSRTWTIEQVSLRTGEKERLHQSRDMNLIPYRLPGGEVLFNPGGREGLSILGRGALRGPMGPGADWVQAVSENGQYAAVLHTEQGALPAPFVLDVASGRSARIPAPDGARIAIAGFVPAEGGAR